jgi:multiple sugar transport system ATP-binding protein
MDGQIIQVGTPKDIYLRPATVAVAAFIGTPPMNLLPAELVDGKARLHGATFDTGIEGLAGTRKITLGVRPGDLRIAPDGIPARVDLIEDLGDSVIVNLNVGEQRVKIRTEPDHVPSEGQSVFLAFQPRASHIFDGESGVRLDG